MARNLLSVDTTTNRRKQTGIDAQYIRSNIVSLGNNVNQIAIVFSSAVPDANYTAELTFKNTVDSSPIQFSYTIIAQSASGFTALLNDFTDSTNYSAMYHTMGLI